MPDKEETKINSSEGVCSHSGRMPASAESFHTKIQKDEEKILSPYICCTATGALCPSWRQREGGGRLKKHTKSKPLSQATGTNPKKKKKTKQKSKRRAKQKGKKKQNNKKKNRKNPTENRQRDVEDGLQMGTIF